MDHMYATMDGPNDEGRVKGEVKRETPEVVGQLAGTPGQGHMGNDSLKTRRIEQRVQDHDQRIIKLENTFQIIMDEVAFDGKKTKRSSAKGEAPPPPWTEFLTPSYDKKNTKEEPKDGGSAQKRKAAHSWNSWAGIPQASSNSSVGSVGSGSKKKKVTTPEVGFEKKASSAMMAKGGIPPSDTPTSRRDRPSPNTFTGLPRPNVHTTIPLRFNDTALLKTPQKGATKTPQKAITKMQRAQSTPEEVKRSSIQPARSRKRVQYGPVEPGAQRPRADMAYYNPRTSVSTRPLYDKPPLIEGNYGLKAYRMSGGGCIVTFAIPPRSNNGSRGLIPINGSLIHKDVLRKLKYLELQGVPTYTNPQPTDDHECQLLRMEKVARDVVLYQIVEVVQGAANDRPMFLQHPIPEVTIGQTVEVIIDQAPEPVRTLMVLTARSMNLFQMDDESKTRVVSTTFKAATQMLASMLNGLQQLHFHDPPADDSSSEDT